MPDLRLAEIEIQVSYESEAGLVFEAQRQIAETVAKARKLGRLRLVLGEPRLGVLWFDAHGVFCTSETTDSGFLEEMVLTYGEVRQIHGNTEAG